MYRYVIVITSSDVNMSTVRDLGVYGGSLGSVMGILGAQKSPLDLAYKVKWPTW